MGNLGAYIFPCFVLVLSAYLSCWFVHLFFIHLPLLTIGHIGWVYNDYTLSCKLGLQKKKMHLACQERQDLRISESGCPQRPVFIEDLCYLSLSEFFFLLDEEAVRRQ